MNDDGNFGPPLRQNDGSRFNANVPKVAADIAAIFSGLHDERRSKLSGGMFFEFMRTAYEVNTAFEDVPTMMNSSSRVDWDKLKQIDLDFGATMDNEINKTAADSVNENPKVRAEFHGATDTVRNEKQSGRREETERSRDEDCTSTNGAKNRKSVKETDQPGGILTTLVKKNLSDILHDGLLDSILPYMIPKPAFSQPVIKKPLANAEVKKSASVTDLIETKTASSPTGQKEKDKSKTVKKCLDNEVEIHVCDEEKNIKRNFRCPQRLLIQKMCYFADVTAGQKLEEIDISVHCDVVIFDWLMRWVKKDLIKRSEWPVLEANNVIPIMVSASFLQMEPLLQSCVEYCYENMSEILKTSTVLTCLDDTLLTKLADRFSNEDVEALKDKRDKIQSKLFCKLIVSLAEPVPDQRKGHYGSLSTLFKCSKCGKNIVQSVSDKVPCVPSSMRIDQDGSVHSRHVRDLTWTLNDYILGLRSELRSWRRVYWRLWGDCHFLACQLCDLSFPVHQTDWCCYHPEPAQFFVNEQQRSMAFPLGRYPCCSQRAYRFEALPNREGCKYKEHVPEISTERDTSVLNIFMAHRDVIAMEPPQLFFPERIIRLVPREPSQEPGRLACKDPMWWTGIELAPQRQRLGLLGKIWSGLAVRRLIHGQDTQRSSRRVRQQFSTDTSSPGSSLASDESDETGLIYGNSDDESYNSEESTGWASSKPVEKVRRKKAPGSQRCWSGSLNVRHNQDNQRDFEERAAAQMVGLLTKRVMAEPALAAKGTGRFWRRSQPAGGSFVRLEMELREQLCQSYKCKSSGGKVSSHTKARP